MQVFQVVQVPLDVLLFTQVVQEVVVMVDHTQQEIREIHHLLHQHKALMEVQEVQHLYMQVEPVEVQLL